MPPKNPIEDFIMKVKTPTGEWQELPDAHLIPAPSAEHIDYASGSDFTNTGIWLCGDDGYELCGTLTLSQFTGKRFSRKRIKKLLMSFGVPRNEAEWQSCDFVRRFPPSVRAEILSGLLFDSVFGGGHG